MIATHQGGGRRQEARRASPPSTTSPTWSPGLRLVIEIKNGFHPEAVLEQLYALTPMEDSFDINAVALVDGQPRTLGLRELLEVFVEHRLDVVRRRTAFRRRKAEERLHLVRRPARRDPRHRRGHRAHPLVATTPPPAKTRLMQVFDLSRRPGHLHPRHAAAPAHEVQPASSSRPSATSCRRAIAELTEILDDDKKLRRVVERRARRRRQGARHAAPHGAARVGRGAHAHGRAARGGRRPVRRAAVEHRPARAHRRRPRPARRRRARARTTSSSSAVRATARGQVGLVTSAGRVLRLPGARAARRCPRPTALRRSPAACPLAALVELDKGEQPVGLCSLSDEGPGLALGTADGVVKRVSPDVPVVGRLVERHPARRRRPRRRRGRARPPATRSSSSSRPTRSCCASRRRRCARRVVPPAAWPASASPTASASCSSARSTPTRESVVVTAAGTSGALPGTSSATVKVTPFAEYPGKGRATGGVRAQRFLKGEDTLLVAWVGPAPARAATPQGAPAPLPPIDPRRDGSGLPDVQAGRRRRRADRAGRPAAAARAAGRRRADHVSAPAAEAALLGALRRGRRAARRHRAARARLARPRAARPVRLLGPHRVAPAARPCATRSARCRRTTGTTVLLARQVGRHADDHGEVRERRFWFAHTSPGGVRMRTGVLDGRRPAAPRPRRRAHARRARGELPPWGTRSTDAAAARVHQRAPRRLLRRSRAAPWPSRWPPTRRTPATSSR